MNHSLKEFLLVLMLSNLFTLSHACIASQCLDVDGLTCIDVEGKCGLSTEQCQTLSIVPGSIKVRSSATNSCVSACASTECIGGDSTNYQCTTITNSKCGSNTSICEDIDIVVDGGYKVRTSNSDNTCTSNCGTGKCILTDAGVSYCTSQQGLGSNPILIRSKDSDLCVSTCDAVVDHIVCQNFSLPSYKCDVASSSLFYNATADGVQKVCLTECPAFKCAHATTFQCMTPESGKVFISSSQVCAANCSTVNPKCFDENFICVNPDNEHLSKNNGSACISEISSDADECPTETHCMNLLKFTCLAPEVGQYKEEDNYYCVSKCSDETKCGRRDVGGVGEVAQYNCIQPASGNFMESNNSLCVATCTNPKMCANTNNICMLPTAELNFKSGSATCVAASGKCGDDDNLCIDAYYYCTALTTSNGFLKNSSNGFCKCLNTQCLSKKSNSCIIPYYNNLADDAGGFCLKKCPNTQCYLESQAPTFVCKFINNINPPYDANSPSNLNVYVDDGDGSNCKYKFCSNKNKCWNILENNDSANYRCTNDTSKLSNTQLITGDGGKCSTSCTKNSECWDDNFQCQPIGNGVLINLRVTDLNEKNKCFTKCPATTCTYSLINACLPIGSTFSAANTACKCANANSCLDYGKNLDDIISEVTTACIDPVSNKIGDGDGTTCKFKCSDSTKCWQPSDFKCVSKSTTFVTKTDGGQCFCVDSSKCLDDTNNTCITPVTGKVNDGDGGKCGSNCSDKTKCYDSTSFQCIKPNETNASDGNGGECFNPNSDDCEPNTDLCVDPDKYYCRVPPKGRYIQTGKSFCVLKCDSTYCSHKAMRKCLPKSSVFNTVDAIIGGECECTTKSNCYKTDEEDCTVPTEVNELISNNDGLTCVTGRCSSTSKCFHPVMRTCHTPPSTGATFKIADDGSCICLAADKCIDPAALDGNGLPSCISPIDGKAFSNTGKCVTLCDNVDECIHRSTYICIKGAIGQNVDGTKGECVSDCEGERCRNPVKHSCVATSDDIARTTADGVDDDTNICVCVGQTKCFDSVTGECVDSANNKVVDSTKQYNPSCRPTNTCTDANYCVHPILFACINMANTGLIKSDGMCICSNLEKCINPDQSIADLDNVTESICVSGSPTRIIDGQGSLCLSKCKTGSKTCFIPTTGTCMDTEANGFEPSGGHSCKCADHSKCLEGSTCISTSSGKIGDGKGGVCTTTCNNTYQCIDNFKCRNPTEGKVSWGNGTACQTLCDTNKCHHPKDYLCVDYTNLTNKADGISTFQCKCANGYCLDPFSLKCVAGSRTKIDNQDGYMCTSKCSDLNKCYKDTNFLCISPITGFYSNSDGGKCVTTCSDDKCYNSSKFCITPTESNRLQTAGGECNSTENCGVDTCIDPSETTKCYTVVAGFAKVNNYCDCTDTNKCFYKGACISSYKTEGLYMSPTVPECTNSCPEAECLHPVLFQCITPTVGLLDKDPLTGHCKCLTRANCLNPVDFTCIAGTTGKISDNDGTYCKTECSLKTKCYQTSGGGTLYTCTAITSSNVALAAGGECSTTGSTCSTNTYCVHPASNVCQESGKDGVLAVTGQGSKCTCVDKFSCLDSTSTKCIKGIAGKIVDPDSTDTCRTSCSNTSKCYDENFICINPNYYNVINDSTGGACTEFCNDDTKCFSPIDYTCTELLPSGITTNFKLNALGIECECNNSTTHCYTANNKCETRAVDNANCLNFYTYQLIWFVNHELYTTPGKSFKVQRIGSIINSTKILSSLDENSANISTDFTTLVTGVTGGKPSLAASFTMDQYHHIRYRKKQSAKIVDIASSNFVVSNTVDYEIFIPNMYGYKKGKPFVAFNFEFDCALTGVNGKIVFYQIKYFNNYTEAYAFYDLIGDYDFDKVLSDGSTILNDKSTANLILAKKVSTYIKSDEALKDIFLLGKLDSSTITSHANTTGCLS